MSQNGNLDEITVKLDTAYSQWKANEKLKDEYKQEFFEALTSQIDRNSAATKVILLTPYYGIETFDDAKKEALKQNPGWKVIGTHLEVHNDQDDEFWVTLEEDLDLKPAAYINHRTGKVYQRTVVEGATMLDDEAIRERDPELWARISVTRVVQEVRPLEELSPEDLEAISKYIYRKKPEVRFLAPRLAREDELNEREQEA